MADELDPVPVEPPTVEVKLFGKWSSDEVHVNDISLAVSTPPEIITGREWGGGGRRWA